MQTQIDFTHRFENNNESQTNLDNNRQHFNKQCQKVLDLLKSGKRLTVKGAIIDYNISSLPRRILDLKEKGIDVKDCWNGKIKEYYIND